MSVRVHFEHAGEIIQRDTRFLFNALGRNPSVSSLDLVAAGVKTLPSGHLRTNSYQQTTAPNVYAAGDCSGPHEIVHVAIRQGETAAAHALDRKVAPMDYDGLLSVVFTDPLRIVSTGVKEVSNVVSFEHIYYPLIVFVAFELEPTGA